MNNAKSTDNQRLNAVNEVALRMSVFAGIELTQSERTLLLTVKKENFVETIRLICSKHNVQLV